MPHISVCVCTYKRPEFLRRGLEGLCSQQTGGLFTFSVSVVDNDQAESARSVCEEIAETSPISVSYYVEPKQSIALARNKAVQHAAGDYIAFIDDDEFPSKEWLLTLFTACREHNVDGVLGPVNPCFGADAPQWVVNGRFYRRPTYPTGMIIHWRKGRTGNTLLKREIFRPGEPAFRPEFLVGEDQDFFRRMIERGHIFMWCQEAVAYEFVPPIRWKRSFILKRALLRGATTLEHPTFGVQDVARSMIAIPAYTVILPVSFILGQRLFMTYLEKLFDHLGRLLALVGIRPVRGAYVTE